MLYVMQAAEGVSASLDIASAPGIAHVHFKSTDASYQKVRMDETGNPSLHP